MTKRIPLILTLMVLLAFGPSVGSAKGSPTTTPVLDLSLFIAPPPAQDSAQTKAEIDEILGYQKTRTPEMVASAVADAEITVFRFADVLGSDFKPETLPLTAAFFDRVLEVVRATNDPAKDHFGRPRPYVYDTRVEPCVKKPTNLAYPSGHSAAGTAMAVLLAHMLPEKKEVLLARGQAFSENRVIGGVHYRSDVVAGEITGVLLAADILKDPSFEKDFKKAAKELRMVLGMK